MNTNAPSSFLPNLPHFSRSATFGMLIAVCLLLLFIDISVGAVRLSLSEVFRALIAGEGDESTVAIVRDIRTVKAVVAVLVGFSLSVSGLQMQTLFRNPLAGPYVLGISSGASIGVALFLLGGGMAMMPPAFYSLGIAGAAWVGSIAILLMIALLSRRIKDIMVILILGMMFSSGASAIVQILQYSSNEESLKSFVIWTMGSLGEVTSMQLFIFIPAVVLGLLLAVVTIKPLNMLLFGEDYARTMGLDINRSRWILFASTTLLAGTSTAFCGPIGFIGLAIPHVARLLISDSNHRVLMPATLLCGGIAMLLCDIISKAWGSPINAVTALLGIPVVVWVVMKNR